MLHDCIIIGGGPAGLNAALLLGRARRSVLVLDGDAPRNAVTRQSHGFLTRDGVTPGQFRDIARAEVARYPSVEQRKAEVTNVRPTGAAGFVVITADGSRFEARKVLLATGLKESLPAIPGLREHYGSSLFNCPYCDGWELRDLPLVIVSAGEQLFHMAKLVYNWSRDLLVCANGTPGLTAEQRSALERKGIAVQLQPIQAFAGAEGQLQRVVFADGTHSERRGGFVTPLWLPASPFGRELGCELDVMGGIVTDGFGRTSVPGVFAAGDASVFAPSQLVIAAAAGGRAAIGINGQLTEESFFA
ncbi:NAD(P)/FAD-dependent oxidoreductase [Paenibacillus athensensis]|uniref:Pyridine nucleotide-disulfide oxidoreductase n=1 Tax=Paenibacillus athensensis TaxID=1967502 RepID=A0A4Y8Q0G1_9BACL|nr:NAD(P)/FAD-dependent oxidoreductase [Paenibacillus athensensis]MCD1261147.1 NAD(P)/FAD-dependent oxidoreductase [Paenibacillus athensensis]